MLLFLYRFFCGYLYVKITSKNPEKIINLCAKKGLNIWGSSVKNGVFYLKISIKSFRIFRKLKRGIEGKIHITGKVGLPFLVGRYKRRYGMILGLIAFFFILQFMSGFIWNISVDGNVKLSREEIIKSLNSIGVFEGAKISDINVNEKRNELLIKDKRLSWAAFNCEGAILTVEVKETVKEEVKDKAPSNLISGFDGVIKKIEVINGTTAVKVGDAVHKGDLLVSGFIEYTDGSTAAVRSRGKIIAEVYREFLVEQPLTVTEDVKTGEVKKRSVLEFFGLKIPLYFGDVTGNYIKEVKGKTIENKKSYLPLDIKNATYYMVEKKTYTLSEAEARKRLMKKTEEIIGEELGDFKILSKSEKMGIENGKLTIKVKINCLKNIVFEEKLLIDTRN